MEVYWVGLRWDQVRWAAESPLASAMALPTFTTSLWKRGASLYLVTSSYPFSIR